MGGEGEEGEEGLHRKRARVSTSNFFTSVRCPCFVQVILVYPPPPSRIWV